MSGFFFQNKDFFYIFVTKHTKISEKEYVAAEENDYPEKLIMWQHMNETHINTGCTGYNTLIISS